MTSSGIKFKANIKIKLESRKYSRLGRLERNTNVLEGRTYTG